MGATMTKQIKLVLAGVGSALDVFPDTDYSAYVPKQDPETRMKQHWTRTGDHLRTAMDKFARVQEES